MSDRELVKALRCCVAGVCDGCPHYDDCVETVPLMEAAADRIEDLARELHKLREVQNGLLDYCVKRGVLKRVRNEEKETNGNER